MGMSCRVLGLLGCLGRCRFIMTAVIGDGSRRALLVATGGLAVNAAFAVWNLALGVGGASTWFVTMGCYYTVLAAARFCCVFRGRARDKRVCTPANSEWLERVIGIALVALRMVLSGMVVLTMHGSVDAGGNRIVVISQATYTFLAFAQTIHAFARRCGQDSVERSLRGVSVVAALVSMFSLQTTMLATFGGEPRLFHTLTVTTGAFVCVANAAVGVSLIRAAGRAEKVGP